MCKGMKFYKSIAQPTVKKLFGWSHMFSNNSGQKRKQLLEIVLLGDHPHLPPSLFVGPIEEEGLL